MSGPEDGASAGADAVAAMKRAAAEQAVRSVLPGMAVGLGTGSTAIHATRRIAELLRSGELADVRAFATSRAVWDEAVALGIPMLPEDLPVDLDLTIDGADEVDPDLNLIKGGGAALTREKIAAQASAREIIVVDAAKLSPRLGTHWPVPVEVLPFGWRSQSRFLQSLGARVELRIGADGTPVRTDQGNLVLDAHLGPLPDPVGLAAEIAGRAGVVEHGLFLGLVDEVVVASADGVRVLRAPSADGPSLSRS